MSISLQQAKEIVLTYQNEFDRAEIADLKNVLKRHTAKKYQWRGMHPFYEKNNINSVIDDFWKPLKEALCSLQRREDFFFAGYNDCEKGQNDIWVLSAGHLMGLFDKEWLGIPPNHKMAFLHYAEFHCVSQEGNIIETAFFCDIIGLMYQAGQYPLPPMTGAFFIQPGPQTHDGIMLKEQDAKEAKTTLTLVNNMAADLDFLNKSAKDDCSVKFLAKKWHQNMIWYGPAGIGSTYTIERYQKQHQFPFRKNLKDKIFNGHVARFAEGSYCSFFGWPNLNNKNVGGFLGLTANDTHAPMNVVDIYRREGDKLMENWVIIDILNYLYSQGLDVLKRMKEMKTS